MNCTALLAADLSGETATIETGAFFGCSELTAVTLSDKISTVSKTSFLNSPKVEYAIDGNGKYLGNATNPNLVLVSALDLDIKEITVNANTKVIANGALSNCDRLEKVTLGAAVAVIDAGCFENSPIEYTIYENVRYLGTAENPYMVAISVVLTAAETVRIHEGTKVIAPSAFIECFELQGILYPKTVDWNSIIKPDAWIEENGIVVSPEEMPVTPEVAE